MNQYSPSFLRPAARFFSCFFLVCLLSDNLKAQTNKPADEAFTIENYYKIKWGYADEFISLWQKNHYPLLKKAREHGDIIKVIAEVPIMHSGEDTRWDFKVTIVFKNSERALAAGLTSPYKKELYPDLEKLARDEQHRFELLIAHWDIMVDQIKLDN